MTWLWGFRDFGIGVEGCPGARRRKEIQALEAKALGFRPEGKTGGKRCTRNGPLDSIVPLILCYYLKKP